MDQSAGTPVEAKARKLKKALEADIESGAFARKQGPTFLEAAVSYIEAGGDPRFVGSHNRKTDTWDGLIGHFGEKPLGDLDQAAIDEAAMKLYPKASAATRNRQVYGVISAILKRAGVETTIHRPKGSNGKKHTFWLTKEQAFALLKTASEKDAEFGLLVRTLLYTGMRLSEALGMKVASCSVSEAFAYVPTTKNGDPRGVFLPPVVIEGLKQHPRGMDRPKERVFRFTKSGRLYTWLDEAMTAAGIELPPRTAFHVLRHTWATWMRRYAGLDTRGLVGTGAWADAKSAARYEHVVATEEAKRASLLPVDKKSTSVKSVDQRRKRKENSDG